MEPAGKFEFGPLIALVVFAVVVIIIIDYLTKAGGAGSGIDLEKIGDRINEARSRQKKPEEVKRGMLRRIKIAGLVAAASFALAAVSLAYLVGAMLELYVSAQGDINMALSGLILGAVMSTFYTLQFLNQKRIYEKYYGSIFKQK